MDIEKYNAMRDATPEELEMMRLQYGMGTPPFDSTTQNRAAAKVEPTPKPQHKAAKLSPGLRQKLKSMTDAELQERGFGVIRNGLNRKVVVQGRPRLKNKPLKGAVHIAPKNKRK